MIPDYIEKRDIDMLSWEDRFATPSITRVIRNFGGDIPDTPKLPTNRHRQGYTSGSKPKKKCPEGCTKWRSKSRDQAYCGDCGRSRMKKLFPAGTVFGSARRDRRKVAPLFPEKIPPCLDPAGHDWRSNGIDKGKQTVRCPGCKRSCLGVSL